MKLEPRFLRFLATGVLNTAFGYGVYALLVALGVPYLAALALATIAGIVFNFFSFGRLAFRVAPRAGDFPRFIAAYAASLGFNAVLLWALHQKAGLGTYVAQLVCIPPTVLATYMLLNHWVYSGPGASHGG